ncbi:MAG: alpha-1,4-glucan--maltose-1-phosphate maltosyltransferase [Deltaproteobacteria bacterium]|nr:alpha-1,4-glucan--maltose-1-phosphate maltosyltransferase [Deltaproteobacteria bacterium]
MGVKGSEDAAVGSGSEPARFVIANLAPTVDAGRHPIKRVLGDPCPVTADILRDGHDVLAGRIAFRGPGDAAWRYAPLAYDYDTDRWHGSFLPDRLGRWTYTIEAWTDRVATWRRALAARVDAGRDLEADLREGAALLHAAARHAPAAVSATIERAAAALGRADAAPAARAATALRADALPELVARHLPVPDRTRHVDDLVVIVDRERARFAAWYELFPRSSSPVPGRHGTLRDAAERLPAIAALGFDVVYLPPVHPIGRTHRKGPNGAPTAGPDDPGSPWAIGGSAGGHTAIEPALGTLADFDHLVAVAARHGLEIALDFAPHCSPDHPWIREHPDWFVRRADGSLKCAENPPYTFEDIVPVDFWCADRAALWTAWRDVVLFWVAHGVRAFRVDNPHTKPFAFWEWLIAEVTRAHPDVLFLAEAFTRPKTLRALAALGFSQSYTYFIWRTTAAELRAYLTDLTRGEFAEFLRPAFFPTTPDVLHAYLQTGGRAAFRVRLLLAATLSPLYGIYSGYELCEGIPLRPGGEEYLDSEKFQLRQRDYDAAGNLNDDLRALNGLRRRHRALQRVDNVAFHDAGAEQLLWYSKRGDAPEETLLVVVNLDPHQTRESMVEVPLDLLGLGEDATFEVEDLLSGERYAWRGRRAYVRLDPADRVGQIFRLHAPGAPA